MQDKFEINNGVLIHYEGNDEVVVVPDGITSIGKNAFFYCSNLKNIQLPNSLTSIGKNAFFYCSNLKNIQLPNSLTSIEENAFKFCSNLKNIQLPNSLTSIGENAFSFSSLENIQLPNSLISIGEGAFFACSSLKNVQLPNNLTNIGNRAFWYCKSLESIQFPDSLISIGEGAFSNCNNLKNIQLPNSLISIGESAFFACNNLKNVQLPNSLTSIGESAFYGYSSLTIYGYVNSYAQKYAEKEKIPFVIIDEEKTKNTFIKEQHKGIKLMLNTGNFLMLQQDLYVIKNTYIYGNIVYLEDYFKINLENGLIENEHPNPFYQWQEIHSQRSGLIGAIANTLCMCTQIWKGIIPYQPHNICNSLTGQMNLYLKQYELTNKLTENNWKFYYKNQPTTFEKIFDIIPANALLKELPKECTELYIKTMDFM